MLDFLGPWTLGVLVASGGLWLVDVVSAWRRVGAAERFTVLRAGWLALLALPWLDVSRLLATEPLRLPLPPPLVTTSVAVVPAAPSPDAWWPFALVVVYVLGAVVMLGRTSVAIVRAGRLTRRATPIGACDRTGALTSGEPPRR